MFAAITQFRTQRGLAGLALIGAAALGIVSFGSASVPVAAQGPGNPPAGYVCLARTANSPDGSSITTRVMVKTEDQAWVMQRGFAVAPCESAENWMRTTGPSICALAADQEPGLIAEFQQTHGLTPAEICTLVGKLPT